MSRAVRTLTSTFAVVALLIGAGTISAEAARRATPSITLSSDAARTTSGDSSQLRVPSGATVHVESGGLDVTREAVLYKGKWSTDPTYSGWLYQYYKGFAVNGDGTLAVDEVQSDVGTFRYQVCQYYPGKTKNDWVCTPYAEMSVE